MLRNTETKLNGRFSSDILKFSDLCKKIGRLQEKWDDSGDNSFDEAAYLKLMKAHRKMYEELCDRYDKILK